MAKNNSESRERVLIFDTTLRDGEQMPGVKMDLKQKLQIADMLEDLRVDVIEAGFPGHPSSFNGGFEAVSALSKRRGDAIVCALAGASRAHIDRASEALRGAKRRRIHTFISTHPSYMKKVLKMEPAAVLERVDESVRYARQHSDDVEWSAEHATKTNFDFLLSAIHTAIAAGATTINLPDTSGVLLPGDHQEFFKKVRSRSGAEEDVIFSTHCHNDFGVAVANSLAGIQGGARQIECTINGIGERAGNAALEEVVMAIKKGREYRTFVTNVRTKAMIRASKLVSEITQFPVQPNKAIVGRNAFKHESGMHQNAMLVDETLYQPFNPKEVGGKVSFSLGKLSGRHAFRQKIKDLGFVLENGPFERAFAGFKNLADQKQEVLDSDILDLITN